MIYLIVFITKGGCCDFLSIVLSWWFTDVSWASPLQANRLTERQTPGTEGQPAKGSNITEARHNTLITTDGRRIHTGSPRDMRGLLREKSACFPGSKTVSVLCEQWRPSSVLAALISQPAQAGVKLIWRSLTRGRNIGEEVMQSMRVLTLPPQSVDTFCSCHLLGWKKADNRSSVTSCCMRKCVCKKWTYLSRTGNNSLSLLSLE